MLAQVNGCLPRPVVSNLRHTRIEPVVEQMGRKYISQKEGEKTDGNQGIDA